MEQNSSLKPEVELKLLIVVRHGEYGDDFNLNQTGREQIQKLAEQLRGTINGRKTIIFSAFAKRVSQSAEIISKTLGVPFEKQAILWSDMYNNPKKLAIIEMIRDHKYSTEVIILVTHAECVGEFPVYFACEELGMDPENTYPPLPTKGQACLINCVDKSFQLLG